MKTQNELKKSNLTELFVALLVGSLVYALIMKYRPFGLGWFMALSITSASCVLLGLALFIGILLKVLRVQGAFSAASFGVAIAYSLDLVVTAYFQIGSSAETNVIIVVTALIGFTLSLLITRFVRRSLLVVAAFVFLGVTAFGIPHLSAKIGYVRYSKSMATKLATAVNAPTFTVYKPTYVPTGMTLSPLQLSGYDKSYSPYPRVNFQIDRMEVVEDAVFSNQALLINPPASCDLNDLELAMKTSQPPHLSAAFYQSHSHPCTVVGKTPQGSNIYFMQSGQLTNFYTQIGTTNIMFMFDAINAEPYSDSLLPQMIQTIDSLQAVPYTTLANGTPY